MQAIIELKVFAVSEIIGNHDVGIIMLSDKGATMQIAVVCDKLMKEEIGLRLSKQKICNTLLPEVLVNVLKNQVGYSFELIINDIVDGVYRAMLINSETRQSLSLRASDAILLHLISDAPIYATNTLMQRQAVPVVPGSPSMALPYNALSDDMLREALKSAVEQEKYEMSSTIRDELKRRGKL